MEGSAANKRKTAASGDSAVLHSIADVLKPLSIAAYDNFRTILARIPAETPDRFGIISELMIHNNHGEFSAEKLETVHKKLELAKVVGLDRQDRQVYDGNDYKDYAVIAIPAIKNCVHCKKGPLVVRGKHAKAFFYRLSGEVMQGASFSKCCSDASCPGAGVSSYAYSYWTDEDGRRRMYSPADVDFDVYWQEWHQVTNETYMEVVLLRHAEMALYYGQNGSLTVANIYNTTHQLQRFTVPPLRESDGLGPTAVSPAAVPARETPQMRKAMRYCLERRQVKTAMHGRRVLMFVFQHAPDMCPEITTDTEGLSLAMVQVNSRSPLVTT